MTVNNILLVDDDPHILVGMGRFLRSRGYEVTCAESGEQAINLVYQNGYSLIITDLVMGTATGIDVLKAAKDADPEIQVIILTGYGDMDTAIDALRLDADDFLIKPCQNANLLGRVKTCLKNRETNRRIKMCRGILPVCCICGRVRDDTGKPPGTGLWMKPEIFLRHRIGLSLSSTYCPTCYSMVESELDKEDGQ